MPHLICGDTGKALELTKQIADSGEGTIWETERTKYLAKVFKNPTKERIDKLKVMLANKPSDPNAQRNHISFAWPESLLSDKSGQIVGFMMPQIVGGRELLQIYNPSLRKKRNLEVDWRFLHVVATNIAHVVQSIHDKGYIIGDIKPQNILVNNQALVSIIDTDSFQVKDPLNGKVHHCLVGSQGFTPPELLGKDISTTLQNTYHDRFRLGVVIYYLLFGNHPFQGKWIRSGDSPEQDQLIRNGWWPYAPNSPIQSGPSTISLDTVDPQIKEYFLRCFNAGYQNIELRPSAQNWYHILRQSFEDLQDCSSVYGHVYRRGYQKCCWCERKAALGVDIFELQATARSKSIQSSPSLQDIPIPVQKSAKIQPSKQKINKIELSASVLEFRQAKFGEKITHNVTITNPIPQTLLKARWEVLPHPNDPPHKPNCHPWISFSPQEFKGNQVSCKITVNTSKLQAQCRGSRKIVLKSNSLNNSYYITLNVQTLAILSDTKKLPWLCMTWLLIFFFGIGYIKLDYLSVALFLASVISLTGFKFFSSIRVFLSLLLGWLFLFTFLGVVNPIAGEFLAGIISGGIGAIAMARYDNLPEDEKYQTSFLFLFLLIVEILGTFLGIGLKKEMYTNIYLVSGLLIISIFLLDILIISPYLNRRNQVAIYRQQARNLIKL